MKRPNRHVKRKGFSMQDSEAPYTRHCQDGFVPAEQYVREQTLYVKEQTLKVSMQMLSIQHSLDTPEWRRQHSLDETMIALLTLSSNRPTPPLKKRQETAAVL